ncbi:MAG: hypothetical protein R3D25_17450 [Geminicoccaceae bacterium]
MNDIRGGAGADVFLSGASPGLDTLHDFEVGIDTIEILWDGRTVQLDVATEPGSTRVLLDGIGPIVQIEAVVATMDDLVSA